MPTRPTPRRRTRQSPSDRFARGGGAEIEHGEPEPGDAEALRDRAPHVAEADQADAQCRHGSGSASTSRAMRKLSIAAGTPQ
jgi:hypothetical protein